MGRRAARHVPDRFRVSDVRNGLGAAARGMGCLAGSGRAAPFRMGCFSACRRMAAFRLRARPGRVPAAIGDGTSLLHQSVFKLFSSQCTAGFEKKGMRQIGRPEIRLAFVFAILIMALRSFLRWLCDRFCDGICNLLLHMASASGLLMSPLLSASIGICNPSLQSASAFPLCHLCNPSLQSIFAINLCFPLCCGLCYRLLSASAISRRYQPGFFTIL